MASLHPSATIARIDGRWPSLHAQRREGKLNDWVPVLSWLSLSSASQHFCCWTQNSVHQEKTARAGRFHQPTSGRATAPRRCTQENVSGPFGSGP